MSASHTCEAQQARLLIARHERDTAPDHLGRQQRGAFYTPPALAQALARAALGPRLEAAVRNRDLQTIEETTVLDPTAGAGSLLLEALLLMADAHRRCSEHLGLEATPARERCARLSSNLFGIELDGASGSAAQEILASVCGGASQAKIAVQDALLDQLPETWPTRFDGAVANPPFGTVNRLEHSRQRAMAERFKAVWQDKIDRAALFVTRALELSESLAAVVPSALLAAHKAGRWRRVLSEGWGLRVLDLGELVLFERTQIRTAILIADAKRTGFEGWRCVEERCDPAKLETLLLGFASEAPAPPAGVISTHTTGPRWNISSVEHRALWKAMDAEAPRLGSRYFLGKGMETGCNAAFRLPEAVLEELSVEERQCFVRRRIRGVDVGQLVLHEPSRWLLFAPAADDFDALPKVLRQHLSSMRERLEGRAAFQRGDCVWWSYTWPLHRERYACSWRVITPYRAKSHCFSVVEPGGGLGLTDTTALFVDEAETAWALAGWLCSGLVRERFRGLTKHTGGGMMEFFENQLRELPLPRGWDGALIEELAALTRQVAQNPSYPRDAWKKLNDCVRSAYELE